MKGQEIKAEEKTQDPWRKPPWIRYLWRNLFVKKPTALIGYPIFEEASLKTNSSHWKPPIFGESSLKSGIPLQHQNKGTASRDSSHDAPLINALGNRRRSSRSSASILPFCIRVRVSADVQSAESPPS